MRCSAPSRCRCPTSEGLLAELDELRSRRSCDPARHHDLVYAVGDDHLRDPCRRLINAIGQAGSTTTTVEVVQELLHVRPTPRLRRCRGDRPAYSILLAPLRTVTEEDLRRGLDPATRCGGARRFGRVLRLPPSEPHPSPVGLRRPRCRAVRASCNHDPPSPTSTSDSDSTDRFNVGGWCPCRGWEVEGGDPAGRQVVDRGDGVEGAEPRREAARGGGVAAAPVGEPEGGLPGVIDGVPSISTR